MTDYINQLVVYESGSIKKIDENDNISIDGNLTVGGNLTVASTSGLILEVNENYAQQILAGDIVNITDGVNGGVELVSTNNAGNYPPIGVALEDSSSSTSGSIKVHTIFGARVNVNSNTNMTLGRGSLIYLDSNKGKVTNDISTFTTGQIWRLGVAAEDYLSGSSSINIIWMPQLIEDLG